MAIYVVKFITKNIVTYTVYFANMIPGLVDQFIDRIKPMLNDKGILDNMYNIKTDLENHANLENVIPSISYTIFIYLEAYYIELPESLIETPEAIFYALTNVIPKSFRLPERERNKQEEQFHYRVFRL
ncbi:hypothetical protein COEREDRAFT_90085 [Coemansia reversa NRRL 1564]|uniref:Uncharacterized protein n=1 Tax=Coemansia reversa (strain ATCC 12441 / NRRL 1564) TaxID=763665 RepID=A0A2G5B168_COERN|nr:hypothetical protein COEREDRAFT_90085 [Coemansia reversa NRRL 1564]|eukprot:PIA12749.1 hypothetical protein COEREDRAFT_90085 [Coemansia reversa NRRL 1564]